MRSPRTLICTLVVGAALALAGCNDASGGSDSDSTPGYTQGGSNYSPGGSGEIPDRVDPALDPDGNGRFNPGPAQGPYSP
jgi:hypothetical protein